MRNTGLILALVGLVAGVAAIALVATQLDGDSSAGGGPGGAAAPGGTPAPLGLTTLDSDQSVDEERAPVFAPAISEYAATTGDAAGGPATGGTAGATGLALPQTLDRKIIRTATLELTVEDVGGAAQRVENAALAAGGFVSASSLLVEELPRPEGADESEPPPKRQTATVTIRVPAEAYASVMSQLRGIADEIDSESSQSSEVTEEYTDLQARLRNLEATEGRYLELLAKAQTIPDILTVQDRLNSVRAEIEQVQGRINLLDNLTDMATITVQLSPPLPVIEEEPQTVTEPGWAEEAWENAWEASEDALKALGTAGIVMGVVLVWLAVPAIALAVGRRLLSPRREHKGEA
ncbi:MAG: DUF4349 domain-containing protein [Chloroflexi bacterium]|nr:DUF4349 domain-containing protein [Chloroflexota bacterium]